MCNTALWRYQQKNQSEICPIYLHRFYLIKLLHVVSTKVINLNVTDEKMFVFRFWKATNWDVEYLKLAWVTLFIISHSIDYRLAGVLVISYIEWTNSLPQYSLPFMITPSPISVRNAKDFHTMWAKGKNIFFMLSSTKPIKLKDHFS